MVFISSNSATSPLLVLTIPFEINSENGLGSLPNQDASAPFKLQVTGNTSANIWQTAPTTIPAPIAAEFAAVVRAAKERGPQERPPDMAPGTAPRPPRPGHEPKPKKEDPTSRRRY